MLYTRKGDDGTTKAFDSKPGQRISKSSCQTESLGALDELNSFLGLVKVKAAEHLWTVNVPGVQPKGPADIAEWIQHGRFTIQAEVAGADKRIGQDKVTLMEGWIDEIERQMPPISTFFVSGGTELAALFDIARTLARTAERRVISAVEEKEIDLAPPTLSFMNRLSSLLYALARYSNFEKNVSEKAPQYD